VGLALAEADFRVARFLVVTGDPDRWGRRDVFFLLDMRCGSDA
jgi:hypothetical protein